MCLWRTFQFCHDYVLFYFTWWPDQYMIWNFQRLCIPKIIPMVLKMIMCMRCARCCFSLSFRNRAVAEKGNRLLDFIWRTKPAASTTHQNPRRGSWLGTEYAPTSQQRNETVLQQSNKRRDTLPRKTLVHLTQSLAFTHITYCLPAWAPPTQ